MKGSGKDRTLNHRDNKVDFEGLGHLADTGEVGPARIVSAGPKRI